MVSTMGLLVEDQDQEAWTIEEHDEGGEVAQDATTKGNKRIKKQKREEKKKKIEEDTL